MSHSLQRRATLRWLALGAPCAALACSVYPDDLLLGSGNGAPLTSNTGGSQNGSGGESSDGGAKNTTPPPVESRAGAGNTSNGGSGSSGSGGSSGNGGTESTSGSGGTGGAEAGGAGGVGGAGGAGGTGGSSGAAGAGGAGGTGGAGGSGGSGGGTGGSGSAGGSGGTGGAGGAGGDASTLLIDDMEDDDYILVDVGGRDGFWFTFNDGTGTQTPAPGSTFTMNTTCDRAPPASATCACSVVDGSVSQYAGLGFSFHDDDSEYDASMHSGIRFWAKNAQSGNVTFTVLTATSTAASGSPGFETSLALTTSWAQYVVAFSDLSLASWYTGATIAFDATELVKVQFQTGAGQAHDLSIDDVEFVP